MYCVTVYFLLEVHDSFSIQQIKYLLKLNTFQTAQTYTMYIRCLCINM